MIGQPAVCMFCSTVRPAATAVIIEDDGETITFAPICAECTTLHAPEILAMRQDYDRAMNGESETVN